MASPSRIPIRQLGLILAICAIYLPALQCEYIWDDDGYVIGNTQLRTTEGLKNIWLDPSATPQYYPLVHTTFWIEYQLWELDPKGYHAVNIVLHAMCALLLFQLLSYLKLPGALFAAALFALHPIQVETVAWVTERKNLLSLLMYLLSALCYLRAVDRKQYYFFALAFICYIAAMLSKTVAATLPAALLLILWGRVNQTNKAADGIVASLKRIDWRAAIPLLPMFVVGIAMGLRTARLEVEHVGAEGAAWDYSFIERCLIAGRVGWFYVKQIVLPIEFIFNYPRWEIDSSQWWQYLFPAAWVAVIVSLWMLRKKVGIWPLVGVFFYLGTLMPASGFFDVYPMRFSFVADHFQYHAGIGVFALLAGSLAWTVRRWQVIGRKKDSMLPLAGSFILLAAISVHTWVYIHAYHDERALWLDTLDKNPNSWMAHNYLGRTYERRYDYADRDSQLLQWAEYHYRQGLKLHDQFAHLYANLASVLNKQERYAEAEPYARRSVELLPELPQAHYNLGLTLREQGKQGEAIEAFTNAVKSAPRYVSAHHNLASLLAEKGDIDRAILHFQKCIELRPGHPAPHLELASLYVKKGAIENAKAELENASRALPPDHPAVIDLRKRIAESKPSP